MPNGTDVMQCHFGQEIYDVNDDNDNDNVDMFPVKLLYACGLVKDSIIVSILFQFS